MRDPEGLWARVSISMAWCKRFLSDRVAGHLCGAKYSNSSPAQRSLCRWLCCLIANVLFLVCRLSHLFLRAPFGQQLSCLICRISFVRPTATVPRC